MFSGYLIQFPYSIHRYGYPICRKLCFIWFVCLLTDMQKMCFYYPCPVLRRIAHLAYLNSNYTVTCNQKRLESQKMSPLLLKFAYQMDAVRKICSKCSLKYGIRVLKFVSKTVYKNIILQCDQAMIKYLRVCASNSDISYIAIIRN